MYLKITFRKNNAVVQNLNVVKNYVIIALFQVDTFTSVAIHEQIWSTYLEVL